MLNLLTNAVEAFPVSKTDKRIEIRTRLLSHDYICVDVIDNGKGISEEVRKQIFTPLFTTKGAHGTGLGLAITEKIVRECGGTIELTSSLNEGSCFTISLPVNKE